jgi:hypothetical protein
MATDRGTRPWRLGASWSSRNEQDPSASPLVTIVEQGTGEPDEHGRRADDRLVGALGREDAERVVVCVNECSALHAGHERLLKQVERLQDESEQLRAENDQWRRGAMGSGWGSA